MKKNTIVVILVLLILCGFVFFVVLNNNKNNEGFNNNGSCSGDVSGNDVSGNDISGNDVSGNDGGGSCGNLLNIDWLNDDEYTLYENENKTPCKNNNLFKLSLDDYIGEYYKHFWNANDKVYSDDYILKTQIVPPVCPSCPASVTCSNAPQTPQPLTPAPVTPPTPTPTPSTTPTPTPKPITTPTISSSPFNWNWLNQNVSPLLQSGIKPLLNSQVQPPVANAVLQPIANLNNIQTSVQPLLNADVQPLLNNGINAASSLIQTPLTKNFLNANSRGLAGNYNGDIKSNTGYMGVSSVIQNGGNVGGSSGVVVGGGGSSANVQNYYNAVPEKQSTNFMPITSDFSKFGR